MTDYRLVTYLKEKSQELRHDGLPPSFFHGDRSMQNLKADDIDFPIVFVDHPITSRPTKLQSGYMDHVYRVMILFGLKAQEDWTDQEMHDPLIQEMRDFADKYVDLIDNDSRNVNSFEIVNYLDVISELDVMATGVVVTMNISLIDNKSYC